jgi:UDP-N-acetylmuramate-alanine ligase
MKKLEDPPECHAIESLGRAVEALVNYCEKDDIILTVGAGDIGTTPKKIFSRINKKAK